ncbi:MAG: gamma-glutamylcyclotransferase [Acidobacteriota bacterium]|nr:gamma-glutamylcyclotransferase [Acidobacteriota bacterium]
MQKSYSSFNHLRKVSYNSHKGFIKNYKLEFNKKSIDGSGKANITESECEIVWGVCYELDVAGFENLRNHEKGYEELEIIVHDENQENLFSAKTFISNKTCDKLPTKDYLNKIIEGAKQHKLPEEYIKKIENQPIQES